MMSKLAIREDKHNLLNVFRLWAYYGEKSIYDYIYSVWYQNIVESESD